MTGARVLDRPDPIIRFEHFSCGYVKGAPILRDITLDIFPGQFVLLVGQSGSGTSTLGSCLNGIIPLVQGWTEGSLTVAGINAANSRVAELATHAGVIFQDVDDQLTNLYARDEVMFGPENLMLPAEEVERRAWKALEFVGATDCAERFVFELSGGQKQKVVIAAVLGMEPEILFLDEPTANLDPRSSSDVFRFLSQLKRERRTLIITEYKMDELVSLADRIIVLADGEVRFDGEPREVIEQHGQELQERWGLWIPQAAELEIMIRQQKGRHAEPFPVHTSEAVDRYRAYRFEALPEPNGDSSSEVQGEVLIRASDVSYRYSDGTIALANASVEVRAGEILAIVGPNGSGKTTLSKHFVGLLKPTSGKVMVFGKDTSTTSIRELTRYVGYVFQYPEHQFVKDSVGAEVRFSLQALGVEDSEIGPRVQEVLAIFGLDGLEDRHPYSLSGGQKRRLSVATMVIVRPRVLLMDEPTFAQDRRNTERMMEAVLTATAVRAGNLGSTIVLITHDMKLVADYATRVVAMHEGAVAFDGSPRQLFADRELLEKVNLEEPALFGIVRGLREAGSPVSPHVASAVDFVASIPGRG